MTQETVRVEGDETLARTLRAASDDLEDMSQAGEESARVVEQRARAAAPKVSGALAGSLTVSPLDKGTTTVVSDLIYAPVIHYGWAAHNIAPNPFLTEALGNSTELVVDIHDLQVGRILSQVRGA